MEQLECTDYQNHHNINLGKAMKITVATKDGGKDVELTQEQLDKAISELN